jgi:hypothetical protein
MHPTADTKALTFLQSFGAAGDAGRYAEQSGAMNCRKKADVPYEKSHIMGLHRPPYVLHWCGLCSIMASRPEICGNPK